MARLRQAEPDRVAEIAQEAGVTTPASGPPGPMLRTMANAPAVLKAYYGLSESMKRVHLSRKVTERVSLAVQAWLGCELCIAAHTKAARAHGLTDNDIELAKQGTATEAKIAALVAYGLQVAAAPGEITDADVAGLQAHGWTDQQITEVVALVALNVLTGSLNLVAGLEPEFVLT